VKISRNVLIYRFKQLTLLTSGSGSPEGEDNMIHRSFLYSFQSIWRNTLENLNIRDYCCEIIKFRKQYFEVFPSVHSPTSNTSLTALTTCTIFIYNIYLQCFFYTFRCTTHHHLLGIHLFTFHDATAVLIINKSYVTESGFQSGAREFYLMMVCGTSKHVEDT